MPYLISHLYARFRRYARQHSDQQQEGQTRMQRLQAFILSIHLPVFDSLMQDHLRPLHLAWFFLAGRYYSMAKRWLQVRLVRQPLPT